MYGPRVALWCLAGCFFCLVFLSIANRSMPMAVTFLFFGVVMVGSAETYADRRRKREKFNHQFPSIDDFFQAVDRDALLRIREERGVAVAVRELRRQYPSVSLATAAQLVKGL